MPRRTNRSGAKKTSPPPPAPPPPPKPEAKSPPPPAAAAKESAVGTTLINAVTVIAAVTAGGVWVASFTDWFRSLTLWLLISGIVAWLMAGLRVVPPEGLSRLRANARAAARHRRTWQITAAVSGVLLLVSSFLGTVEVVQTDPGRVVDVTGDRRPPGVGVPFQAPSSRTRRLLCWVGWPGRTLYAHADGLPPGVIDLRPWWQTWGTHKCVVPGSFLRPVVAVGADADLLDTMEAGREYRLSLRVNGEGRGAATLTSWQMVVIGGGPALEAPIRSRLVGLPGWEGLTDKQMPPASWASLRPADGTTPLFRGGERVAVALTEGDGGSKLADAEVVLPRPGPTSFVVPILLRKEGPIGPVRPE